MTEDFRSELAEIVGHSRVDCVRLDNYRRLDPLVPAHSKKHAVFAPSIHDVLTDFDLWLKEHDQELIFKVVARLHQEVEMAWDSIPSWKIEDLIEYLRNGELTPPQP